MVVRRVVRLADEEEGLVRDVGTRPDESDGAGGGGAGQIPAFTFNVFGLSMYFSIKRSLFQPMCRKSSDAESVCMIDVP